MDSKIRSELRTSHVERGSKIVLEALHFLVVLSSNFQLTYFCPSEEDYRVRLSLRTIKVRLMQFHLISRSMKYIANIVNAARLAGTYFFSSE